MLKIQPAFHMEEFVIGINVENTSNYIEVEVTNPGADGEEAQICARGPDDLVEFFIASSQLGDRGFTLLASADDRDLPLEIETCYSLAANQPYATMDMRLINNSNEDVAIWWTELLSGCGEVQAFQPQVGFGDDADPLSYGVTLVDCGNVDWSREAQPGMDFPEYASYGRTEIEVTLILPDMAEDTWLVAIAHGPWPMAPTVSPRPCSR
jgi:hypothetical protein